MNKILRFSFMAVLALIANMGFAQATYLWQEDFSSYKANDVPAGGTYNYVCVGTGTKIYADKLAGGVSPELLVQKKDTKANTVGSFTATVPLNGATGNFTLAFKANRALTVTAVGATLGTETKTGNDSQYSLTVAAGTTSVTITFTSATTSNTRLDNIKLFQGEAKKPAGLSWGTASRTVTIGSEDNLFPTLSNANNLPVTYSTDDPDVADIDATTGEITLVDAGEAVITAKFAGNDEYEAAEVSYTLTVKVASAVSIKNTPETAYTVAQAHDLITAGEDLDTKVYVKGIICKVAKVDTGSFGNANYDISDDGTETNKLEVYRGYYLGGEKFTAEDQIKVNDVVVVYGKLANYNNTHEFNSGSSIYSLNGTTGINGVTVDAAADKAPAYNLAGQRVNAAYKGIVVKNGKKVMQ